MTTRIPLDEFGQPVPGTYQDVSFEEYLGLDAFSSGAVNYGLGVSMRHALACHRGELPDKWSDALRLGAATHSAILEPHRFQTDWRIARPCCAILQTGQRKDQECGKTGSRLTDHPPNLGRQFEQADYLLTSAGYRETTRDGTQTRSRYYSRRGMSKVRISDHPPSESFTGHDIRVGAELSIADQLRSALISIGLPLTFWVCGTHGKNADECREVVTAGELQQIRGLQKTLRSHQVMRLLGRGGFVEQTEIADWCGVRWKCRHDFYAEPYNGRPALIVDLKTCEAGKSTRSQCEKTIFDYHWHRQAARYRKVHELLTGEPTQFAWIFAEKGAPYDLTIVPMSERVYEIGVFECEMFASQWKRSEAAEHFAGVSERESSRPIDNHVWEWDDDTDTPKVKHGGLPQFVIDRFAELC